ncbi:MAG: tetratricopeptide repeat protein [Tatlockia sp.]|nr:tetratricopeptide repeat protein [Tatlockia sp.]
MTGYMTEEEQLAAIKKWWTRHSNTLTIILSLILLAIAGYKYWNWHQDKVKSQASSAYERLMVAFSNKDDKGIQAYANQLINDYPKTVYADAARLAFAKLQVNEENYDKALESLEYVVKNSKMSALKQIARLRIARLLSSKKAYSEALTELSVVDDKAYMPVVNELKGDIFTATGQFQQAVLSYKEAITEVRTNGMGNLFLEMKTNELAALNQSLKATASSGQAT